MEEIILVLEDKKEKVPTKKVIKKINGKIKIETLEIKEEYKKTIIEEKEKIEQITKNELRESKEIERSELFSEIIKYLENKTGRKFFLEYKGGGGEIVEFSNWKLEEIEKEEKIFKIFKIRVKSIGKKEEKEINLDLIKNIVFI